MRTTFQLAPVIADIIAAHCPHTVARRDFMRACIHEDWQEAKGMVQGMLAEPWLLRGYQEIGSVSSWSCCRTRKPSCHAIPLADQRPSERWGSQAFHDLGLICQRCFK